MLRPSVVRTSCGAHACACQRNVTGLTPGRRFTWRTRGVEASSTGTAAAERDSNMYEGVQNPAAYKALSWVGQQGTRLRAEAAAAEEGLRRQQWLQDSGRVAGAAHGVHEIDEEAAARLPYHKRLAVAAQAGRVSDVEWVLEEMQQAGLRPGPRAYHSLVFAYARDRDAEGALDAIRRVHGLGIQPIAESYVVLIHAFVQEGNVAAAEAVLASMKRAGLDARAGWLVLASLLFQQGFVEQGAQLVDSGMAQGWTPSAQLYEHMVIGLCKAEQSDDALQMLNDMVAEGVLPTPRHFNPVIQTQAQMGSFKAAEALIYEMANSSLGDLLKPNADSYNCLLKGYIEFATAGEFSVGDKIGELRGWMSTEGVAPNAQTHALSAEAYLHAMELEDAVTAFFEMWALGATRALSDGALASMLAVLGCAGGSSLPRDVLRIMQCVEADGRRLPMEAFLPMDADGSTFLTSWLANRYNRLRVRANPEQVIQVVGQEQVTAAVGTAEEQAEASVQEVEGVYVGLGNFVVDETGAILSPSKLTVHQMRVELMMRGLLVDGRRKDLYKRIQAARKSAPQDGIGVLKKRAAEKRAQLEEQRAEKEEQKVDDRKGRDQDSDKAVVVGWSGGEVVEEEDTTADGSDSEDEEEDEDEQDEEQLGRRRRLTDADDLDADVQSSLRELGLPKFNSLLEREAREAKESVRHAMAANTDAGVACAAEMLQVMERAGGCPSAADLVILVKAADAEQSPSAARVVANWVHRVEELGEIFSPAVLYGALITICLKGDEPGLAAEIALEAEEHGYEDLLSIESLVE